MLPTGKAELKHIICNCEQNIDLYPLLWYNIIVFLCFVGGVAMAVCYDRLWKLLIDKHITKTEMRKRAGISTSVLAKMGKNETVSMDTLAKIATALECGLDDIVEIQNKRKGY